MIRHIVKWEYWYSHIIMHYKGFSACRGYILFDVPNVFRINTISVIESEQGNGHGNGMLRYVQKYAKNLNCNRISLEVNKTSWMLDWYLREEFEIVDSNKEMFILEKMLN